MLGAIDCSHIGIEKPGLYGDEYVNRKGYVSVQLNVQFVCNPDYIIHSVNANWPGSVHDSRIWKTSNLYQSIQKPLYKDAVLLGDGGYANTPFLLTPFKHANNDIERKFNHVHCRARVTIEQCFGQLKRRFPILHYGIRLKLESAPRVIIACAVLHNIARYLATRMILIKFQMNTLQVMIIFLLLSFVMMTLIMITS